MRRATYLLIILLALGATARAQEEQKPPKPLKPPRVKETTLTPTPPPPVITTQIAIGEAAPDFELDGSEGRPVRLAHLKGYRVLLVFADGRAGLASLREIDQELRKVGVRTYGICGEKAYALKSYADRQQLPYVLLSDVTGEVSQLYGLYDVTGSVIRPGFMLIDRRGFVQVALLGQSLTASQVIDIVSTALPGL